MYCYYISNRHSYFVPDGTQLPLRIDLLPIFRPAGTMDTETEWKSRITMSNVTLEELLNSFLTDHFFQFRSTGTMAGSGKDHTFYVDGQ